MVIRAIICGNYYSFVIRGLSYFLAHMDRALGAKTTLRRNTELIGALCGESLGSLVQTTICIVIYVVDISI